LKGVVFASVPEPRGYVWWLQLINAADTNQLDCSLKILKAAAKRFDSLEGDSSAIDKVQLDSITAEYYMLRVYLVRLGVVIQCTFLLIEFLRLGNRGDPILLITFLQRFR
jgi:hypothetical protein